MHLKKLLPNFILCKPKVKTVKAIEKYKLHILFDEGTDGDYDVTQLAGNGVFKSWDDDNNLFKVGVNPESGAITWPGELDIDTINAYCHIKGVDVASYFNKELHAAY